LQILAGTLAYGVREKGSHVSKVADPLGSLPPDGDLLLQHARQAAKEKGVFLEASFEDEFLAAVRDHWREPGHTLEEARANTNGLIFQAINIAQKRGKNSLDGDTFRAVLAIKDFCPLWPFC
jgi:hypothetical protein